MAKAKKRTRRGANKSEAIRKYQDANPKAGPTEVAKALGEQGIKVTPAFVSTVRSMDRKKSGRGRRRGAARGADGSARGVSFDTLIKAKALARKLGGVQKAKAALDALAQLV
jgi:hypothetical protein